MSCTIVCPLNLQTPTRQDLSYGFIKRLIAFYKLQPAMDGNLSAIWTEATKAFHQPLHAALVAEDKGSVMALLNSVYHGCTMFGLDYGDNVLTEGGRQEAYFAHWLDLVWRAAVSLGVIPLQNAEQPFDDVHDAGELFAAMESVIGCPLGHLGGGGAFGINVNGRFVPRKLLDAICSVGALARLQWYRPPQMVYELGAGSGMLASLLLRARPSICKYVINDLPLIAVIQAYLLALAFSEDTIRLAGEPEGEHPARIVILGQTGPGPMNFDLAINQDSLPEMPRPVQDKYLQQIQNTLNFGGLFYSVNQESLRGDQHRVFCAIQKFTGLKQIQRSPYWGRDGYVEEVWVKT